MRLWWLCWYSSQAETSLPGSGCCRRAPRLAGGRHGSCLGDICCGGPVRHSQRGGPRRHHPHQIRAAERKRRRGTHNCELVARAWVWREWCKCKGRADWLGQACAAQAPSKVGGGGVQTGGDEGRGHIVCLDLHAAPVAGSGLSAGGILDRGDLHCTSADRQAAGGERLSTPPALPLHRFDACQYCHQTCQAPTGAAAGHSPPHHWSTYSER